MDDQRTEVAPPGQEAAPEKRERVFLLPEGAPLPEGVEEGDEGVFVIRPIAATRKDAAATRQDVAVTREIVEAENVAYLR